MYGENAPQFILQLAILLKENAKLEPQEILILIFKNQAILTSLLSLLKRSVSIYLELAPRQKSGQKQNDWYVPYTNWKNSLIVGSMILLTVTPRVLSLAVYFGSCFPMFGKDNQGELVYCLLYKNNSPELNMRFIGSSIQQSVVLYLGCYVSQS